MYTRYAADDLQDQYMTSNATQPEECKHRLITFMRHAETVANVAHLLQGSTDSPLSVHGSSQVDALCKGIVKGLQEASREEKRYGTSPLLNGTLPTKIFSSPLGRTWRLASAVHTALKTDVIGQNEEGTVNSIELVARPGLEEKSFGKRENCRGGQLVPGFPIGIKAAEDPITWHRRVQNEGNALLKMLREDSDDGSPHYLVITHGLWISSFMKLFLRGEQSVPFADNTGIFTLAMVENDSKLRVVCANDTSHLVGLKRQRRGIGSSASDKRQRNLADMWSKK